MGLYFRKSKSFGPFRLNFSKSGVGVSAGVKGARLSMGPNGTYVNVGRNGIYYRKKISGLSTKKNRANTSQPGSSSFNYENTDSFTDAIKASPTSGNTSELSENIIKDIKRAKGFTWGWVILSVALIALISWWSLIPIVLTRIIFHNLFNASITYDLDSNASLEWDKCSEIINMLKSSKKLWIIESSRLNSNTKYNAGAARNISRSRVTVKKIKPRQKTGFRVKTDVFSVLIKSRKCSMLFLPSGVIVKKRAKLVAYSYDQLQMDCSTTSFIENEHVPRDAEIIRYTWQYVNKNGTADKRFNSNRQIPVCRYGLVRFVVGQEMSIELHTSNKLVAENMGNAYQFYRSYINTIELAPPTAEYAINDIESKSSENSGDSINGDNDSQLEPVAAADVGLFDDDEEIQVVEEDFYSDLFETETIDGNSNNDNALIDDMSMFLEEDKNGNV